MKVTVGMYPYRILQPTIQILHVLIMISWAFYQCVFEVQTEEHGVADLPEALKYVSLQIAVVQNVCELLLEVH